METPLKAFPTRPEKKSVREEKKEQPGDKPKEWRRGDETKREFAHTYLFLVDPSNEKKKLSKLPSSLYPRHKALHGY